MAAKTPRPPRKQQLPACGRTHDGSTCTKRGTHFCKPRADHAQQFFHEILVHTKGSWARRQFILAGWQRDDLIRPIFGKVRWSAEWACYVRVTRIVWIELARKQGKAILATMPILTGNGWSTMGELVPGDQVHALDGALVNVEWVSEKHTRPSYNVTFADGSEVVAADDHKWWVYDARLGAERVATTEEMASEITCWRGRRWAVSRTTIVERPEVDLPVDPYVLGAWLGDGSSYRADLTSVDEEIIERIRATGQPVRKRSEGQTFAWALSDGVRHGKGPGSALTLNARLRKLGLFANKHVPEAYLLASADQRLDLLRGLMDTDGSVIVSKTTPRVEFTSTSQRLADAVLFLARSLGWKPTIKESDATIDGRVVGRRWRVAWTAYHDRSPFALTRKTERLFPAPTKASRAARTFVTSVEPVGDREVVCISIDHPSHVFLVGRELIPTHNSEMLAGIALYLLVADGEEAAEIYGAAKDRDQARKVFDVAARMVQLSPVLSKRLLVRMHEKRIIDQKTGSYYEVIAADAAGNLGHNPHGIVFDEILTQPNGDLWNSLRTAMGTRIQPLMVAATTPGDDPNSWCGQMHNEMQKVADEPDRAPHQLVYMRNTPIDADPWDEANWFHANPALGDFLSLEALRDEALEAKNDPTKENSFRQFRLAQWVRQRFRWMPMHLYNACIGEPWMNPKVGRDRLKGKVGWFGLDLAAKFDLTAWCVLIPTAEATHALWRFWLPEEALPNLDDHNEGKYTQWAKDGWLTVTEGNVVDYDRIYREIAEDAKSFHLRAGDADQWSMAPVIQEIEKRTGIEEIVAYQNSYARMTPGMNELMAFVKQGTLNHHGNPIAALCFESVEVQRAPFDPDLIRPFKPERVSSGTRIDAVPALAMACAAWRRTFTQVQKKSRVYGF